MWWSPDVVEQQVPTEGYRMASPDLGSPGRVSYSISNIGLDGLCEISSGQRRSC